MLFIIYLFYVNMFSPLKIIKNYIYKFKLDFKSNFRLLNFTVFIFFDIWTYSNVLIFITCYISKQLDQSPF